MAKSILTDSCFWLGLVDTRDQHHAQAQKRADEYLDKPGVVILMPWPCLYETVSTRLVRNRNRTLELERLIKNSAVHLLNDAEYRDAALETVFNMSRIFGHSYSLTDGVIREMLKDDNLRVDSLITFNASDFADACELRRIHMIN